MIPVQEDRSAQLYCVLIALADDTLLLPNAAVAETVGQEGLMVNEAEPRWVAGELEWNRRSPRCALKRSMALACCR